MDSIHQAKVKSGHLLHKIALVQSQRNSTVPTKRLLPNTYVPKKSLNYYSRFRPKIAVTIIPLFIGRRYLFLIIVLANLS